MSSSTGTYSAGRINLIEKILPWPVLAVLLLYTGVTFFVMPYPGFDILPNGRIGSINRQLAGDFLQEGDQIIQVGSITWESFRKNLRQPLFWGIQQGDTYSMVILRNGQQIEGKLVYPDHPKERFIKTLPNIWWLGYPFWFFGTVGLLTIRPRSLKRNLFVAFNYLTAAWLSMGPASSHHIWESAVLMRVGLWLCIPVYWHFHWQLPRPLSTRPVFRWFGILVYLLAGALALAELFLLLPNQTYGLAFLLAIVGSVVLLVRQYQLHPDSRSAIRSLTSSILFLVVPAVVLVIIMMIGRYDNNTIAVLLLVFPFLPGAYFYAFYRRQLGGLELRANRAIILIFYSSSLAASLSIIIGLYQILFRDPEIPVVLVIVLTWAATLASLLIYPRFARWVERRVLHIPLPPTEVIETYSAAITTSMEEEQLVRLLRDQALPSLLVRQAALLRIKGFAAGERTQRLVPIFKLEVTEGQIPRPADVHALLESAGVYRPPGLKNGLDEQFDWVRLALALKVEGKPVAVCLLGRRDPDDYYAGNEIPTLQALMDQTALALLNIEQAQRLRALHQNTIGRQEDERRSLARDLHDDVLGQLALLAQSVDERQAGPQFSNAYEGSVKRIRDIIAGLRPAMLAYGLGPALDELGDEAGYQVEGEVEVNITVSGNCRYTEAVELHLFRIAQQACHNALKHAQARLVSVDAVLEPNRVEILVKDDGVGFPGGEHLDLAWLLANKHYGLAGMYERAALIGAHMEIQSEPGKGTEIHVVLDGC